MWFLINSLSFFTCLPSPFFTCLSSTKSWKCNTFFLAVQREMLKDQSGSKGGSLAEALGTFLQGMITVKKCPTLAPPRIYINEVALYENPALVGLALYCLFFSWLYS